jgi:hypothetical protein
MHYSMFESSYEDQRIDELFIGGNNKFQSLKKFLRHGRTRYIKLTSHYRECSLAENVLKST